jgi:sugar lactone lactonase YvrE
MLLLCGLLIRLSSGEKPGLVTAQTQWNLSRVFKVPESALYDAGHQVIFVSNINGKPTAADGNGFISQVSPDGKVITLHWVDGLNAPKGLAVFRDTLWVADLDAIVQIDIRQARIVRRLELQAQFMNDLTVDSHGTVYSSDSFTGQIYRIKDSRATVWIDGGLAGPNGFLAEANRLLMLSNSQGTVNIIDYQTKKVHQWVKIGGSLDGIVACGNDYLVSNFSGEVYYLTAAGQLTKLIDTIADGIQSADIGFIPDRKLLLVPTFSNNSLTAYEILTK